MLRTNPTALSVTIEDVNNLVIRRSRRSSSGESEAQVNNQTSQQRILGRSEDQYPHAAAPLAQTLTSPAAASTKDGHSDASPGQTHVGQETNDSHMEDVSQSPLPALAATHTGDGNTINARAGDGDVEMGTPQQHGRAIAQITPGQSDSISFHNGPPGDSVSPRWLSLPPRRPHPAWTAAEREIATSPLANRAPR